MYYNFIIPFNYTNPKKGILGRPGNENININFKGVFN